MKYKVGDTVIVKGFDWYIQNYDEHFTVTCGGFSFIKPMSVLCGKECIIKNVDENYRCYDLVEDKDGLSWTDEMFC